MILFYSIYPNLVKSCSASGIFCIFARFKLAESYSIPLHVALNLRAHSRLTAHFPIYFIHPIYSIFPRWGGINLHCIFRIFAAISFLFFCCGLFFFRLLRRLYFRALNFLLCFLSFCYFGFFCFGFFCFFFSFCFGCFAFAFSTESFVFFQLYQLFPLLFSLRVLLLIWQLFQLSYLLTEPCETLFQLFA